MRVLLAEDNQINREIATYFLVELQCVVLPVVDGSQAVDAYQNHDFDIVLMDIQMPKLNGIEATQKIREIEQTSKKRTPILALTAYTMENEIQQFLNAGMDDHVAKPLSVEKLREVLKKWCPQFKA